MATENENKDNKGARESANHSNLVFLAILFIIVAFLVALVQRAIPTATLSFALFCFCLSLAAATVTFGLLNSTASIKDLSLPLKSTVTLGGASAGLIAVFLILYNLFYAPFTNENKFMRLAVAPNVDTYVAIADANVKIDKSGNRFLQSIANESLQRTRSIFDRLASGRHTITPKETPDYLIPIVKSVKKSYYATQFVRAATFWKQAWTNEYVQANVFASQKPGVKLERIFILSNALSKKEKLLLSDIMEEQFSKKLHIKVVITEEYPNADNNREDFKDFLIADDEIEGNLVIEDPDGTFTRIEFSTDNADINKMKRIWSNLDNNAEEYSTWKQTKLSKWLNTAQ